MLFSHVNPRTLDFGVGGSGGLDGMMQGGGSSREFSRVLNGLGVGIFSHSGYGSQRRVGNK